ncbi:MAG: AAA family ATPase [Lachnospiraceae bacterium]|nr:AAA family ATPase [Lachnospiraceae bacterium]
MKTKKVFRRLCLTNWGGVDHTILEFNEYVNLFSGKSGSGKSTAMDALQVILYGSVSSNFLNRAADDNKNKRSVFGYLRGEQKDGSANRAEKDFCSVIALEIEDMAFETKLCVGLSFEVRAKDNEIKKFLYFSHTGAMPEGGYLTEEGIPYSNAQIRKLIETRARTADSHGAGEINRIYNTKDAYLSNLYTKLLGYIDGNRFVTMEKSAIALRMTDGTGQFIKDYMFPKGTGDAIEKLSEQLGAYRDICEKIDDMKKRIELLKAVQAAGTKMLTAQADEYHNKALIKCLDIEDAKDHIAGWTSQKEAIGAEIEALKASYEEIQQKEDEMNEQWAQAKADLQASDLGRKKERLEELEKRSEMLAANSRRWRSVLDGLKRWGEDEIINDYLSQSLLQNIETFAEGKITTKQCEDLRIQIEEERDQLENELSMLQDEFREVKKQLEEKKTLVEDMSNNRKSYSHELKRAQSELEEKLRYACGKEAKVYILADLFEVSDAEWKNAVEGRMGRLRFALVTEPRFAMEASTIFRKMGRHENVDLINTKSLIEAEPSAKTGSLYEKVSTELDYVDACLRRYLGAIICCETEEEMVQAKNAVTKDCFTYHNYMFRHLKRKDYEIPFIGAKVSKGKLEQLKAEYERFDRKFKNLTNQVSHLKQIYNYETLKEDAKDYVELSKAGMELDETVKEIREMTHTIETLEKGEFKELQIREATLREEYNKLRKESKNLNIKLQEKNMRLTELTTNINNKNRELEEMLVGYVENESIREEINIERQHSAVFTLKSRYFEKIRKASEDAKTASLERSHARDMYIAAYPNCEFTGMEPDNEKYDARLLEYQQNYEPQYQQEFEKQCGMIYKSLRDNVIAKIHGDIKGAHRHKREINRLLHETNFADSRYQIEIGPAQTADGQFYEMLMAEELDTKNLDNGGFDGQLSLGEDLFYQKYETQIQQLIDKFMPAKNADDTQLLNHQKEMEKFADYRTYLSFRMCEVVTDKEGNIIRRNYVDEMAGRDSGGEGQNPKYVALLAGFAMLYMAQNSRDSKIKLVLLDEAFSKMDQERSAVCLQYARKMDLQLIVCVPDERLQSLIRNVDCVYGFRRKNNRISMMHIDKGDYLQMMSGETKQM